MGSWRSARLESGNLARTSSTPCAAASTAADFGYLGWEPLYLYAIELVYLHLDVVVHIQQAVRSQEFHDHRQLEYAQLTVRYYEEVAAA
ncbi:MAG: hypothetical protein ABIK28_16270, partial [Planctomycetota bacterium]